MPPTETLRRKIRELAASGKYPALDHALKAIASANVSWERGMLWVLLETLQPQKHQPPEILLTSGASAPKANRRSQESGSRNQNS